MTYLSDRHRRMLEIESGISPKVIAQRGYRTITDPQELIDLGFAPSQARPGLLIPQWTTAGVQRSYMLRPDHPRRNEHDKPLKYEVPAGSSPMIDCPPVMATKLRDPSVPLYITEGSKKADKAATHGLTCVSLAGVYGFLQHKLVIADLDDIHLAGRRVILAFDSDVTTKPEVADARNRLGGACWRRGATVEVVTLPPGPNGTKVGLDDFLAAGNTVADLDTRTTNWHYEVIEVPEIAQLRAERDQLQRDNAMLLRLMANPYTKGAQKTAMAGAWIAAMNKAGAKPGAVVVLSAGDISGDWRPKPEKGGNVAPTNPDGTRPRMARQRVTPALAAAIDQGVPGLESRRTIRQKGNGARYPDTEWIITLPASLGDFMAPAATYRPAERTERKPRAAIKPCPHCGETHPIERVDTCTGCGAERGYALIVPEPPRGDSLGDKLFDKTPPIADVPPGVTSPSPLSTNGLGDQSSYKGLADGTGAGAWLRGAPLSGMSPPGGGHWSDARSGTRS